MEEKTFDAQRTRIFFEGLLPEGFTRRCVAEWMHMDENDYVSILAGLGREQGVYIHVAGTSRPADEYMIKELLLEGSNRSFDQVACVGLKVTDDEVDELCRSLKETALKHAHSEEERSRVKDVTVHQLLSWGGLQEREGEMIPTNAYAILTGNDALPVAIQCGVFNENKSNFRRSQRI
ncbi:HipA N-terminal domain-containing protein [Frisingicoccus sp.]|uniref:HipA N-terminal domain-containing protein n=1 Tax=Frisingicoccus sp. TaxID=1918627 RepID=UPI003AB76D4C